MQATFLATNCKPFATSETHNIALNQLSENQVEASSLPHQKIIQYTGIIQYTCSATKAPKSWSQVHNKQPNVNPFTQHQAWWVSKKIAAGTSLGIHSTAVVLMFGHNLSLLWCKIMRLAQQSSIASGTNILAQQKIAERHSKVFIESQNIKDKQIAVITMVFPAQTYMQKQISSRHNIIKLLKHQGKR